MAKSLPPETVFIKVNPLRLSPEIKQNSHHPYYKVIVIILQIITKFARPIFGSKHSIKIHKGLVILTIVCLLVSRLLKLVL